MPSFIRRLQRLAGCAIVLPMWLVLLVAAWGAVGSQALGPAALRDRHVALGAQLASSQFQGPLHLESRESAQQLEGDVYALVEHSFGAVSAALSDPDHWCDVLILHLNTKYCRARNDDNGATRLELRIGRKHDQPLADAAPVAFSYRTVAVDPEYLDVELDAADGPLGTRDYRIVVEAIPVAPGRSFIHMRYAFAYGRAGRLAMKIYLATIGRSKVGFTQAASARPGEPPVLIGGIRGVVERNTMRYYLAIEAYLDALSVVPAQQQEHRLEGWFAATQKYPRQLYEIDRMAYLDMKRREYQRQQARP